MHRSNFTEYATVSNILIFTSGCEINKQKKQRCLKAKVCIPHHKKYKYFQHGVEFDKFESWIWESKNYFIFFNFSNKTLSDDWRSKESANLFFELFLVVKKIVRSIFTQKPLGVQSFCSRFTGSNPCSDIISQKLKLTLSYRSNNLTVNPLVKRNLWHYRWSNS